MIKVKYFFFLQQTTYQNIYTLCPQKYTYKLVCNFDMVDRNFLLIFYICSSLVRYPSFPY